MSEIADFKLTRFDMEMLTNGDGFGTRELKPLGIHVMDADDPQGCIYAQLFQKHHDDDEGVYYFYFIVKKGEGINGFNVDQDVQLLPEEFLPFYASRLDFA
jgi:hypothetical protein